MIVTQKLSELIADQIDGGEECRGRDAQLTEWVRLAQDLETKLETASTWIAQNIRGGA